MTINERVKEVRKALGLSGEKFGAKIGLLRNAISRIETGKNGVSEQNIMAICREYHVNEQWLRTGEGKMFDELATIDLEALVGDIDPLELDILKRYFSLDKDIRQKAIKYFFENLRDE